MNELLNFVKIETATDRGKSMNNCYQVSIRLELPNVIGLHVDIEIFCYRRF